MRRLNRNYWRLGWVLLTNGVVILLFLTAPVRMHHDQQLISGSLRANPPQFSYLKEFFADPWGPILVLTLLAGIVAEVRRTILSPILNLTPYVIWLIVALWERAQVAGEATSQDLFLGKVLFIFPLTVIIAVDLIFYIAAYRRRQAEGSDLGSPIRF